MKFDYSKCHKAQDKAKKAQQRLERMQAAAGFIISSTIIAVISIAFVMVASA